MIENKRFDTYFDDYMQLWAVSDNENDNMLYSCTSENMVNEFAQLLNELNDENKELKAFQQRVFDLIDDMFKEAEQYFEKTCDSYCNGQMDILKELKKELQE